jgi:hypothetical protein
MDILRTRQKFKLHLIFGPGENSLSDVGGLYQQIEFIAKIKVTDEGSGKSSKALLFQTTPALSHCFVRGKHAHNSA